MRSINLLPPEAHVKEQARERVARLLLFGLVYVGILVVVTLLDLLSEYIRKKITTRTGEVPLMEK